MYGAVQSEDLPDLVRQTVALFPVSNYSRIESEQRRNHLKNVHAPTDDVITK